MQAPHFFLPSHQEPDGGDLMLCGTPSGSEGLTKFLKRKGFKMNKNLYVGNLSFKVTDEDLKTNFLKQVKLHLQQSLRTNSQGNPKVSVCRNENR